MKYIRVIYFEWILKGEMSLKSNILCLNLCDICNRVYIVKFN